MSRTFDPGTYKGKIVDYGISETSKKRPQVFIVFDVNGKNITWYNLLEPKPSDEGKKAPLEIAVKTLLDCGLTGDVIENMAAGKDSNMLPLGKEMDLVIADNIYNGDVNSQIKYVNVPGFIGGAGRMTFEDASKILPGGALRAELIRQRKLTPGGPAVPKSPL